MKNYFDFDYNCIKPTNEGVVSNLEICRNVLYYFSDLNEPFVETNDDLSIKNSKYRF